MYTYGDKFVGDWVDAKKHGDGELLYVNGDRFKVPPPTRGRSRYSKKLGRTWRRVLGRISEFCVQLLKYNCIFRGTRASFNKRGVLAQGQWADDRASGFGVFQYANGNRCLHRSLHLLE